MQIMLTEAEYNELKSKADLEAQLKAALVFYRARLAEKLVPALQGQKPSYFDSSLLASCFKQYDRAAWEETLKVLGNSPANPPG